MSVKQSSQGLAFLTAATAPTDVVIADDMGEDERMLMRSLKEFAAQEVEPVLDRIEQRDEEVILPLFRKAAELGLFMAEVPEEYGGLELSLLAIAGMSESRSSLGGLASTVFAHQGIGTLPLINFGTEAQIKKYLRRCMDGELMAAFALTEPSSGSDAMNIKTSAVLDTDGESYVVNGAKQWITNAGWADLFILFAKVNGTEFTAFLLERNTPGLTVGPHEALLGLHGSSVCALQLDNVRIPVENVLGEIGKGHKVAMCTLNLGRMKMAANCAGTSKKAVVTATEYATERQQFGQPIANFGLIRRKLAEMAARAYAAESVAYRTAGLVYTRAEKVGGQAPSLDAKLGALTEFAAECAIAKVFGSEAYNELADELLQVFGGNGYSEDYPAAQMYRDARITRIYEGTSEICRLSIAKAMLKRVQRGELDTTSVGPGASHGTNDAKKDGTHLAAVLPHLDGFRRIFSSLLHQLVERFGVDGLRGNDQQQFLSSLADIAIELYAAESTVLRVLKLQQTRPDSDTTLSEALARLTVARAVGRIRTEAVEILAGIYADDDEDALRDQLVGLERQAPLPENLVRLRDLAADGIIERKGQLPNFSG